MVLCLTVGLGLGACGGDGDDGSSSAGQGQDAAFARGIESAQRVSAADFPAVQRRTLQQLGDRVRAVQAGLAVSEFTPGLNRIAFGVIDDANKFVYGKSAVYVARSPNSPARGPFPAPADPLVVEPPFRSQGAALESDAIAAIYEAEVPLREVGSHAVLVVTRTPQGLVGGGAEITVARTSRIPEPGERPLPAATERLLQRMRHQRADRIVGNRNHA